MSSTMPTKSNNQAPAKASGSKKTPLSAKASQKKPKKMIANHGVTFDGALKVQQMLKGTFVNSSDTMIHSAPLPFKGVYFTCLCCYLVGIEKKYAGITYTQSHGRKCANYPTFIDWLSGHTELHHLIPQCIEIDEFEYTETAPQVEEDQSFSVSHLHHLQTVFNSKVSEMKEAADLLAEYTKQATVSVPVTNVAIADEIVATVAAPVVNPLLSTTDRPKCTKKATVSSPVTNDAIADEIVATFAAPVVNPLPSTTDRPKRVRKQSAKALAAKNSL